MEEAEKALRRLSSKGVDVKATLAVITETDRFEQELEAGSTYVDCFRGFNLRRTEISVRRPSAYGSGSMSVTRVVLC
jgi:MFS transporter, SP family, general alpha glucoside:H+ symporter